METPSMIRYQVRDHIARITLNRPEKMNALNRPMRKELQEAFTELRDNPDIWLAIITGEGRAFCSGKDLLENIRPEEDDDTVLSNEDLYLFQRTIYKPMIAALNGPCLAQGAGIALCSDIRIMSERASIGWPQVKRGISSVSGPSLLAHQIPLAMAMGYLMRGKFITPEEALSLHLVHEVVPHEELLPAAERWAAEILENAPLAVQGIKEATMRGLETPISERVHMARAVANRVLQSEDSREGIRAFAEKRKPVWSAR